jgi:hypothetical protein
MPAPPSRKARKRLYLFAKKEYSSKNPRYVEVRKAKAARTFYHGPIPQLILTKYKALLYTVFVDYGTFARLYYFNRDGYRIKETSYSESQLTTIKDHLRKNSILVVRYPPKEQKESISDYSVAIDKEFLSVIELIEQLLDFSLEKRPVITLREKQKKSDYSWFKPFTFNKKFLEAPLTFAKNPDRFVVLRKEAFFSFFSKFLDNKFLCYDCAVLATILSIPQQSNIQKILKEWSTSSLDDQIFQHPQQQKQKEIVILFRTLQLFDSYEFETIISKIGLTNNNLSEIIFGKLSGLLFSDYDPHYRLSSLFRFFVPLSKNNGKDDDFCMELLLRASCLERLSNQNKRLHPEIHEFSAQLDEKKMSIKLALEVIDYLEQKRVDHLFSVWRKAKKYFSKIVDQQINKIINYFYQEALELQVEFPEASIEKPVEVTFILKNISDTSLSSLKMDDIRWTPKNALTVIGERSNLSAKVLHPNETKEYILPVIPKHLGSINFKKVKIRFNDKTGKKHYMRFPIKSLFVD